MLGLGRASSRRLRHRGEGRVRDRGRKGHGDPRARGARAAPAASRPVLRATCTRSRPTLYELLAGVPAFWVGEEETIAPLLKRIAARPASRPSPTPACRPWSRDVLELGLQKEPADRPDSVAAFGRRLQETQQACGQAITKMLVTRCGRAGSSRPAGPAGLAPPSPRVAPPPPPRLRAPRPGGPPAPPSLLDQVTVLLESAIGLYGASAERARCQSTGSGVCVIDWVSRCAVAIVGRVKAGKSTLLNALVGEELAPTDAGECTRVVTWYVDGPSYKATLHPREGSPRQAAFSHARAAPSPSRSASSRPRRSSAS